MVVLLIIVAMVAFVCLAGVLIGFVVHALFGDLALRLEGRSRARRAFWGSELRRTIADRLGLALEGEDIVGFVDGFRVQVHVRSAPDRDGDWAWKNEVVVEGVNPALRLEAEGFGLAVMLGGEDHQLGDPDFDPYVRVRGSREWALVLLDQETRKTILRIQESRGARVENGRILLAPSSPAVPDADTIVSAIREAVALARRLPAAVEARPRLLEVIARDPGAALVAAALHLLLASREEPAVREAIATATPRVERMIADAAIAEEPRAELLRCFADIAPDDGRRVARVAMEHAAGALRRVAIEVAEGRPASRGELSVVDPGIAGALSEPAAGAKKQRQTT